MKIGSVKEIKKFEYRVGLTPDNVRSYVNAGHQVYIERNAGVGSGFMTDDYIKAGATILETAREVWETAEMIVKVKEPLPDEYQYFRKGQIIYTYLHLAADRALTDAMLAAGVKGVAYETLDQNGYLPLLAPMSQIAGRLSVQEGAKYLEKIYGGSGVLLSRRARNPEGARRHHRRRKRRHQRLQDCGRHGRGRHRHGCQHPPPGVPGRHLRSAYPDPLLQRRQCRKRAEDSRPGCRRGADPRQEGTEDYQKILSERDAPGSVIVDVAVDQGGCCETTHMTYHDDPIYKVDGVVHYCVGNMPGAVPRTSTIALTNATLSYGLQIAANGLEEACRRNETIYSAINTYDGKLTCKNVADSFKMEYTDIHSCF